MHEALELSESRAEEIALRLSEAEAGPHIYKDLKNEILSLYGPKEQDAYKKAKALRLNGKPSALGKKLIHLLCPGAKPFETCHCAKIVYGMWDDQLTPAIRVKLAGQTFNKDTYTSMFKQADETWEANGGAVPTTPVVAAVAAPSNPDPQVAAISTRGGGARGRGRGGRGRGGGRGANTTSSSTTTYNNNSSSSNTSTNKPHQKGPQHADLPSEASWACAQHWRKGRAAPYCSDPHVCKWVNKTTPRSASTST